MEEIKKRIMKFFVENGAKPGLDFTTDLFKGGYVNSLFALQMVMFLEKEFAIKIPKKEISEKNFKTIDKIAEVVARAKEA